MSSFHGNPLAAADEAAAAARRRRFFAMAMGCPGFIVAVICFIFVILNGTTAFFILGVLLLILSAAGCGAGCCYAIHCAPPRDEDVEAPAAAAPRV